MRLNRAFNEMNYAFICTEYLSGDDLFALIDSQETMLPELIIKQIMFEVLSAVRYAHDREIAHLDIKLENIVLTRPWVKTGDFPTHKSYRLGVVKKVYRF